MDGTKFVVIAKTREFFESFGVKTHLSETGDMTLDITREVLKETL